MTGVVRVVCQPGTAGGFMLAGLAPVEVQSPAEGATRIMAMEGDGRTAIVLAEGDIFAALPEAWRAGRHRDALPIVVPFPEPETRTRVSAEEYVVAILRRAVGYRVRLR